MNRKNTDIRISGKPFTHEIGVKTNTSLSAVARTHICKYELFLITGYGGLVDCLEWIVNSSRFGGLLRAVERQTLDG